MEEERRKLALKAAKEIGNLHLLRETRRLLALKQFRIIRDRLIGKVEPIQWEPTDQCANQIVELVRDTKRFIWTSIAHTVMFSAIVMVNSIILPKYALSFHLGIFAIVSMNIAEIWPELRSLRRIKYYLRQYEKIKYLERYEPSSFAEFVVCLIAPVGTHAAILGDLSEQFHTVACEFGIRRAKVWYWFQIVRSISPFLVYILTQILRFAVLYFFRRNS